MSSRKDFRSIISGVAELPVMPIRWQQIALERIHLFEIGGQATFVSLDPEGRLESDKPGYAICNYNGARVLPIYLFAPGNEAELFARIREQEYKGDPHFFDANDFVNYGVNDSELEKAIQEQTIAPVRRYLETMRPQGFAYKLTDQEEYQVLRMFLEMNRYPAMSSEVIERTSDQIFLGYEGQNIKKLDESQSVLCGGFHSKKRKLIAISGESFGKGLLARKDALQEAVHEEMAHAYDSISFAWGMMLLADLERLTPRVKTFWRIMNNLRAEANLAGFHGIHKHDMTQAYSEEERKFIDDLVKLYEKILPKEEAAVEKLGVSAFKGETLFEMMKDMRVLMHLLHEATVVLKSHPLYQNKSDMRMREEFFAKMARVLPRIERLRELGGEDFAPIEAWIMGQPLGVKDPALEAAGAPLKNADRNYRNRYQDWEIQQGEAFAHAVAHKLEAINPGCTKWAIPRKHSVR